MSWITFDNLKRFWKNVRTNPITFTGEVDLQNTTRYKGNEIATKADVSTAPDLTKYMKKSADSSLDMKEHPIYFGYAQISLNDGFVIDGTGDRVKILGTSLFFNNSRIDTREDNQKLYAPQVSPTFTGTATVENITVSKSLVIPGGKIWIA